MMFSTTMIQVTALVVTATIISSCSTISAFGVVSNHRFTDLSSAVLSTTTSSPSPPRHHHQYHVRSLLSPLFMTDEEAEMEVELATEDASERMEKSVEAVLQNMNTVRTGRASAAILDLVKVDYYGAETPLNQMASISVPNSQQLTIDPYDKSALGDIERAIMETPNLGLTPQNDGVIIRLNIPSLTEDRRKEMLKTCKSIGEDGKVSIRNIRRKVVETIKKMEKNSDIGEDQSKDVQDDIQKMTDKNVKEIETIVERKEKDVMTV